MYPVAQGERDCAVLSHICPPAGGWSIIVILIRNIRSGGGVTNHELELEFRRLCDGSNKLGIRLPFDVIFVDKKANSAGLQLADLVARPVGMSVLRPEQANRAFDVLKRKFFCCGGREQVGIGFENWGLNIHPAPKSEKPR